jgi:hypothetical protein
LWLLRIPGSPSALTRTFSKAIAAEPLTVARPSSLEQGDGVSRETVKIRLAAMAWLLIGVSVSTPTESLKAGRELPGCVSE